MEVSGQLHDPAALPPGKESKVPIEQTIEWTSELAWTLWKRENFLAPARKRNHDSLMVYSVA
jgi:hypothetical protein